MSSFLLSLSAWVVLFILLWDYRKKRNKHRLGWFPVVIHFGIVHAMLTARYYFGATLEEVDPFRQAARIGVIIALWQLGLQTILENQVRSA